MPDLTSNIIETTCHEHVRCPHCNQLLFGWDCVQYDNTFFCDAACAAEFDELLNPDDRTER